ncbi:MAG: hypothetical protein KRP56_02840 [Candidatus Methanogranum gryphiswaldense]|nr:MAG: hypothetical protein KRP56_02840 [Candidatus Methanogranum sp. U3.2.1]
MEEETPDNKAPLYLWVLGPLAFAFTTFYFVRIFSYLSIAFNFNDLGYSAVVFVFMLLLFVLFVNYLLALSRMMTANRRAWASLVRQSCLYILLVVLDLIRIDVVKGDVFGIGPIPMLLCMILMVVVLISRPVRRYYTPIYSEELPFRDWVLLAFGSDPFRCGKIKSI